MNYSFKNDYAQMAHDKVFEKIMAHKKNKYDGYGHDVITLKTVELIKKSMNYNNCDIHFLAGGTQTNMVTISLFLKRYEAVISPDTGHINTLESGAIEGNGNKIITAKNENGKITSKQIKQICLNHEGYHMAKPKMVCISNSTEIGTIYTKEELTSISKTCKELGLYFFIDGARIACAIASKDNDVTLNDLCNLADAFYLGGTKNGGFLGEALVLINDSFKEDFKYHQKNKGALLAKSFFVSLNFYALFEDNLYFEIAKQANELAYFLHEKFEEMGCDFLCETITNQVFVIMENQLIEKLKKEYDFAIWQDFDHASKVIRLVTSFSTTKEDCIKIIDFIKNNL